jgi:lysophospholipase L1-like esterase
MASVREEVLSCVRGAVAVESEGGGVRFHRSPRDGRDLLCDSAFEYVSATPSGVRIEAETDAPVIELVIELTRALYPGTASEGSSFDVVIDGRSRASIVVHEENVVFFDLETGAVDVTRGARSTVRIELGGADRFREIEIWFPVVSVLTLIDVRIPDGATLRPMGEERPLWVHHGSSISQASDAGTALRTWPVIVARSAGRSLVNLGLAGQCQLDPFMARAIRDHPASAISLELGINVVNLDTMRVRAFRSAVHGFLDTIREGHPTTPMLVVSPLWCPAHEDRPGPTMWGKDGRIYAAERPAELARGALTVAGTRDILHDVVALRRDRGDANLHVLDGRELLGLDDEGDLSDGLHPTAAGQAKMAQRFAKAAFGRTGALVDAAAQ